ncbi:MAG: DUF3179 domain-containing protein [Acidobacteria bacterium]|nr:DUF3179 domain-containing protein [Acidobacteriota bacterium]
MPLPLILLLALIPLLSPLAATQDAPAPPPTADPYYAGFVIPRARIKAVDTPQFVPAVEADIPEDAWVFGVVVEGQARAYSLNLLNHHETVNDRVGDKPFAVVWCPLANAAAVYGRRYEGRDLAFEPDGGLLNATLVVRDRETDSLWSILTGDAIEGKLQGTRLDQWPVGEKVRWREWREEHPDTLVLSVDGREHIRNDPYDIYFASNAPFRGIEAKDDRLPSREPVYAFRVGDTRYAVAFSSFEGGAVFRIRDLELFLYRPRGAEVHHSTLAFDGRKGSFLHGQDGWTHEPSGARFDPDHGAFAARAGGPEGPGRFEGLDTFWYMWSLTHPETEILKPIER